MAYSAHVRELSRQDVARFVETTLNSFLDGREKPYAVRDAIREVKALFGEDCLAAQLIERMLRTESEAERASLAAKASDLLDRQIRSDSASIYAK